MSNRHNKYDFDIKCNMAGNVAALGRKYKGNFIIAREVTVSQGSICHTEQHGSQR